MLASHVQSALGSFSLRELILTCSARDHCEHEGYTMFVENLEAFLLPWHHCLRSLQVVNCSLFTHNNQPPCSPRYFSNFPQLTSLNVQLNLNGTGGSPNCSNLDLAGCASLQELDCCNSGVKCLNLEACTAIRRLDCARNLLINFDISACIHLTTLDCSRNSLQILDLTRHVDLEDLRCQYNFSSSRS